MDKLRTVSDTKRNFYQYHNRPINSIYRRVVEELMVEMHLLSVNIDFRSDPIYYLGVCQSFTQFMNGYTPESEKESIFRALCQSIGDNPQEYINKSEIILNFATQKSPQDLINWLLSPNNDNGLNAIADHWRYALDNPKFKYSRLFAIGFYTLLEKSDPEIVKNDETFAELIKPLTEKLNLPTDKLKKDLDLYRSNIEKMTQMLVVLAETLEASKKKRQEHLEFRI
ncbi:photosystem II biogenesis protein Psp29 [Geminocystis sp. GBBB08]|uniref:photosystem II biogenesis protein Psp29 n=1 Tax=Geminocystis sp. GBBB08 TaxID=2604140 RepID=UPI0027E32D13|nr:photosystem II biogenesis protein Psp29 [Geminocystis sp. GBBB08]MBL1209561.1 photosystem II biogenesis protein Psp29 [Geminocystis sp. GBBB08]